MLVDVRPADKPQDAIKFKTAVRKTSLTSFRKGSSIVTLATTSLKGGKEEVFDFATEKGTAYLSKEKDRSLKEFPLSERIRKRSIASQNQSVGVRKPRTKKKLKLSPAKISLLVQTKEFMTDVHHSTHEVNVTNASGASELLNLLSVEKREGMENKKGWTRKDSVKKFPIPTWVMDEFKKAWLEGYYNKANKWTPQRFQNHICAMDTGLIVKSTMDITRIKQTFSMLTAQHSNGTWVPDGPMQAVAQQAIQTNMPLPTEAEARKMLAPALKAILKSRGLSDKQNKQTSLNMVLDLINGPTPAAQSTVTQLLPEPSSSHHTHAAALVELTAEDDEVADRTALEAQQNLEEQTILGAIDEFEDLEDDSDDNSDADNNNSSSDSDDGV